MYTAMAVITHKITWLIWLFLFEEKDNCQKITCDHGYCVDKVSDFDSICDEGYTGEYCHEGMINFCFL